LYSIPEILQYVLQSKSRKEGELLQHAERKDGGTRYEEEELKKGGVTDQICNAAIER
jgi:hypothetical protein